MSFLFKKNTIGNEYIVYFICFCCRFYLNNNYVIVSCNLLRNRNKVISYNYYAAYD